MKNDLDKTEKTVLLRQKAEQLLKNKRSVKIAHLTEADTIKLINELEVRQMELEIQQEELQQAKEEAEECAAHFQNLYNNINDSVFYQDSATGNIISANETAKRIYGYSDDEFKRMKIKQLDNENNVHKIEKQRKILIEKGFVNFESVHITKGGKLFPVEAKVKIIDEKTFISVSRDITDRKKAEAEILAITEQWQGTFDSVNDAIWLLDKEHNVLRSNKKADRIFGTENIGKKCHNIIHGEDCPIKGCPVQLAVKQKCRKTIELQIGDKWYYIGADPILDPNGNVTSAVHIVRDITKQKAIMKVLQRGAEQTKGLNEYILICAGCSLIRDDEKEDKRWVKPADYITERLPEIQFSHGMCPDCIKKWFPEIDADDK